MSFQLFKPMFQFFENCAKPESNPMADLKPIMLCANCDMSATWKGLCTGEAAKQRKIPCHCCPLDGNLWHVHNANLCDKWCRQLYSDVEGWNCFHHEMLTESSIVSMKDEIDQLSATLNGELQHIEDESTMDARDAANPSPNAVSDLHGTCLLGRYTYRRYRILMHNVLVPLNKKSTPSFSVYRLKGSSASNNNVHCIQCLQRFGLSTFHSLPNVAKYSLTKD